MEGAAVKVREVSGTDEPLSESIAAGGITAPELMWFNDWELRRKTSGARPSKKKGDDKATTTIEEAVLWRVTVRELYGEDWAEELAAKESLEESEAEYAGAAGAGSTGPGPSSETSRRVATWDEARKVLCEFDAIAVSSTALIPSYSRGGKRRWQAELQRRRQASDGQAELQRGRQASDGL